VPRGTTGLTGAAGEYFVAAELSLRGWLATVTIKNAPGTDVLAQNLESGLVVSIQTKAASYGNKFQLNAKSEQITLSENDWYVLVKLHEQRTRPTFYVVPRNDVAAAIYAMQVRWMKVPARSGKPHKSTTLRVIAGKHFAGYEEAWELLEHPASAAPLLLDPVYVEMAAEHGFPPQHPGWENRERSNPS
jgi:hypothetical protein